MKLRAGVCPSVMDENARWMLSNLSLLSMFHQSNVCMHNFTIRK